MAQSGLEVDLRKLQALITSLTDQKTNDQFLEDASALLLNRIRTRFLAEQDTQGNPWPPSKAGIERRKKGGTGTLFDTGRLFHSIRAEMAGPGEWQIFTDVEYAKYHQPTREFIGASDADVALIEKLYLKRIKEAIK